LFFFKPFLYNLQRTDGTAIDVNLTFFLAKKIPASPLAVAAHAAQEFQNTSKSGDQIQWQFTALGKK